jgi:multidrug transporter EmrE-like cation transporter
VDLLPLQPYFSKGFRTTFVKQSWRNFTLGTFEVRGEIDGLSNVGEATIIPFESGAVELYVSAPEPHEKDAKQDFLTVLGAARGETNWISADVRRKAQLANGIMWAGYGLALLYLPCWALFFRGQFMRLHGFRTIWQIAAGILIFIPLTMSTGESGGFNLVGYFFSLALLGFAARRIKLGIEYGA